jgi:protoporphyrinogen oxidase
MTRTVVIAGAGPAGLTAALEMLRRSDCLPLVFEADSQVGGISKTVNYSGNRMDLGGHRFFSKSDWVMDWWQEILPVSGTPEELLDLRLTYQGETREFSAIPHAAAANGRVMLVRQRLSRIYYRRRFFDYPLKLSGSMLSNLGWLEAALLGASYTRAKVLPREPEVSLEDFFINRFGNRLYRTFFRDYTEKVWGVPCQQISAEWGAQRIKGLSISTALAHAFRSAVGGQKGVAQKGVETSLIERFLYPRLGPGQMWEEVCSRVVAAGGQVHLRHAVVGLERSSDSIKRVQVRDLGSGETRWIDCDAMISTMPIRHLVEQLRPEDPGLRRIACGLPYRDFMTAGLVVRAMTSASSRGTLAPAATPKDNWIYIQEPDVKLGRLQIFNNWSPDLVADPNTVSLGLEYFCAEGDDLWSMDDGRFLDYAARELEKIGLIDRRQVVNGTVVRVPKAYPAYFGEYRNVGAIRDYLSSFDNLFAVGRNGMHRYNNQDHSMLAAKTAVDCLVSGSRDRSALWSINTEEDYHEERGSDVASTADEDASPTQVVASR